MVYCYISLNNTVHKTMRHVYEETTVRTYAGFVDYPRCSRVLLDVLTVLHHHAVAVVTGSSENLKTVVTATNKSPVALKLWSDVSAVLFAFLTSVDVLCAFVNL